MANLGRMVIVALGCIVMAGVGGFVVGRETAPDHAKRLSSLESTVAKTEQKADAATYREDLANDKVADLEAKLVANEDEMRDLRGMIGDQGVELQDLRQAAGSDPGEPNTDTAIRDAQQETYDRCRAAQRDAGANEHEANRACKHLDPTPITLSP